jgi:hypothetical protein
MRSFEVDQRRSAKRIRDNLVRSEKGNEQGKNVVIQRSRRVPDERGIVRGGSLLYPVSYPQRGQSTETAQDSDATDEENVCKSTCVKHGEGKYL